MSEASEETARVVQTKNELLEALRGDFATAITKVYFNSVGKEYAFKEISVKEQKSLTRMMSANERRKDIIFDSQCAIINNAALDPSFDIYKFSEFDRIKVLLALYQENMFQNDVKFTCEECGAENQYKIDFSGTLQKLDEYKLEEDIFKYENKHFAYEFKLSYPSVMLVSKFHQAYFAKHGAGGPKKLAKGNEALTNLEYINLFITDVQVESKTTRAKHIIKFSDYKVSDIEDILAEFPQDVLYSDAGVLKRIVNKYIQPVNDTFEKHECFKCHAIHEKEGVNSPESFF